VNPAAQRGLNWAGGGAGMFLNSGIHNGVRLEPVFHSASARFSYRDPPQTKSFIF
jgi:hypothetical protein